MHRGAADTEREAARFVFPRSGSWRYRVLVEIARAGDAGLTDWEVHKRLGGNLYTTAPRRKELLDMGWIGDSGKRRATNNRTSAIVWVLTALGKERWP